MQDPINEACEAVQAAAAGKDEAAIRRMLTAELRSREVDLPPELFDVLVRQIAAGTYGSGEPIVSVHGTGLLRVPFIRKAVGQLFKPAFEEVARQVSAGLSGQDGVRVTEQEGWPTVTRMHPRPPGRDLYVPAPDEVPLPARLILDPDLRGRMPELFLDPPLAPWPPDKPPPMYAVSVWLEDSGGTVAVCDKSGRIGILDAEDAEAYLPVLRAAQAQDKVVAAQVEIRSTASGWLPATVRVIPKYPTESLRPAAGRRVRPRRSHRPAGPTPDARPACRPAAARSRRAPDQAGFGIWPGPWRWA